MVALISESPSLTFAQREKRFDGSGLTAGDGDNPPDFSLRGSLRVEISQSWTCEIRSRGRSWLKRRETPCCSPLSKSSTNRRVGAFVVVFRSRNYTYIRTVLVRFDPKQIDGFFFLARLF